MSESELDEYLLNIASKLKLEIFDLDEGVFGFDSRDPEYGIEVVQTEIPLGGDGGLGLVLTELASATGSRDGRGLVLISEVSGNAALADPPIHVGDTITGVRNLDRSCRIRTTALNYDETVEAIGEAKQHAQGGSLHLELDRLVKRAKMRVEVEDEKGEVTVLETLAGENLRRLLQRKGIQIYDERTKRFDMPYSTGDCAGEGICGTCLVAVKEGMDCLSKRNDHENLITKGRPISWRASCRTVVGPDNQPGTVRISVMPQSNFADELNPGPKSVS